MEAPEIIFEKRINGHYYAVVAVPDSNNKALYVVSAYIEKADSRPAGSRSAGTYGLYNNSPTPPTSETSADIQPATNNIIRKGTDGVNAEVPVDQLTSSVERSSKAKRPPLS